MMVPSFDQAPTRDLQALALAFVERYRGDLMQLELAWDVLSEALSQAWQREAYQNVIRLVDSMAPLVGRIGDRATGERMFRMGLVASRHSGDRLHFAAFLNQLGCHLYMQGGYSQGRRLWYASLRVFDGAALPPELGDPLAHFAQFTDIIYDMESSERFVAAHSCPETPNYLVALFIRGLYARARGNLEEAYADYCQCLRLFTQLTQDGHISPTQDLFLLVVQAELARAQGAYTRSQVYTESALAQAHLSSDPYTIASLLIDQGIFVCQQGQLADVRSMLQQLYQVERQLAAPHVYRNCLRFERYLHQWSSTPASSFHPLSLPASGPIETTIVLSEREIEVLRLVAIGYANQEIAGHLVVSITTVKKHLEHIYSKLQVHSRTAAVARARLLRPDL